MKIELRTFDSRKSWEKARRGTIGGSDAAAALGLSPWKTNVQLWEELTGRREPEDISNNPAVRYGSEAEKHIRSLFHLDYPELRVEYDGNAFWVNDKYPFAHASVDGRLFDAADSPGILEIKTTTINSKIQLQHFNDQLPVNYYVQVLYYMAILDAVFAIVCVQLTFPAIRGGMMHKETRHYFLRRHEVKDDIKYVMDGVAEFYYKYVAPDTPPPLKLPEI